MDGEPLKSKLLDVKISTSGQRPQEIILVKEDNGEFVKTKDVKSAVEWLGFKLRDCGQYRGQEWQMVANLLNEAFADCTGFEPA